MAASRIVVDELIQGWNYPRWSSCLKNYMMGQDLWEVVETDEKPDDPEVEYSKIWRKKNAMALHAIQVSCSVDMLDKIRDFTSAKDAWEFLANLHKPVPIQPNDASVDAPADSVDGPISVDLPGPVDKPSPGEGKHDHSRYEKLYWALNGGNWTIVKSVLDMDKTAVRARISLRGETPLHVAASGGHVKVVENLVKLLQYEDLEQKEDLGGFTPLGVTALSGITEIAECMVIRNRSLVGVTAKNGMLPVNLAAGRGHKEMTRYLYGYTSYEDLAPEKDKNGATLLTLCLATKILDVALDLLNKYPRLAITPDIAGITPISTLTQIPSLFPSGRQLQFWQRCVYSCIRIQQASTSEHIRIHIHVPIKDQIGKGNITTSVLDQLHRLVSYLLQLSGIKKIYDRKQAHVQAAELLKCICQEVQGLNEAQVIEAGVIRAVFQAVQYGTIEFIVEITKWNPNLLAAVDELRRDIFSYAILHRQEKIFSLIYGLERGRMNLLASRMDEMQNSMLHLVGGELPTTSRLDNISGPALQMQRELQWFKEVENVVPPMFKELTNKFGESAAERFSLNHNLLMKEGEKWMKEIATSCTVVAALIITIMFAAAFTVPGGNNETTGTPIFIGTDLFMVFVLADTMSLFSATTSALMFLGILTSRYAESKFLTRLPTKLIIGLSSLFISIATMMTAFVSALALLLRQRSTNLVIISVIVLASVPVTLFVLLQFPLLVEIFISTYGPSIFNRKTKRWY